MQSVGNVVSQLNSQLAKDLETANPLSLIIKSSGGADYLETFLFFQIDEFFSHHGSVLLHLTCILHSVYFRCIKCVGPSFEDAGHFR